MATQHVAPDSPPLPDAPETKNWPGLIIVLKFTIFSLLQNVLKLWTNWMKSLSSLLWLLANDYCILTAWSDLSIGSVSPQSVGPPLYSALSSHHSHFCARFALIHTFCSSSPAQTKECSSVCSQCSLAEQQPCVGCREVQMCLWLSVTSNCSFSHITGIFSETYLPNVNSLLSTKGELKD